MKSFKTVQFAFENQFRTQSGLLVSPSIDRINELTDKVTLLMIFIIMFHYSTVRSKFQS